MGFRTTVVINNWDPRDSTLDPEETKDFVRANKWPPAKTVIRHYKLHARTSADCLIVTWYPAERVALQAREHIYRLALELQIDGGRRWHAPPAPTSLPSPASSATTPPVDRPNTGASATPTSAPLSELAPNPLNPNDDLGDRADLVSITGTQLQSELVVTRAAYQRLYPQDETVIGLARWVLINGCRRPAAPPSNRRQGRGRQGPRDSAGSRVSESVAVIEEPRPSNCWINEYGTVETAALGSPRRRGG